MFQKLHWIRNFFNYINIRAKKREKKRGYTSISLFHDFWIMKPGASMPHLEGLFNLYLQQSSTFSHWHYSFPVDSTVYSKSWSLSTGSIHFVFFISFTMSSSHLILFVCLKFASHWFPSTSNKSTNLHWFLKKYINKVEDICSNAKTLDRKILEADNSRSPRLRGKYDTLKITCIRLRWNLTM